MKRANTMYYSDKMSSFQHKSVLSGDERGTFLTGISANDRETIKRSEKLSRNLDRIGRIHTELNGVLDKYGNSLIGKVLKEEDNYMIAYKTEMMKVIKRIEGLRGNNDDIQDALQKEKYVVALEKSLNWFKEEAKKLDNSTTEQNDEKQYLKEKIMLFQQDIQILEKQLKQEGERLQKLELSAENHSFINLSTTLGKLRPRPTTQGLCAVLSQTKFKPGTTLINYRKFCSLPKICQIINYMLKENIGRDKITEQVISYYRDLRKKNADVLNTLETKIGKENEMNAAIALKQFREKEKKTELLNIFLHSIDTMKNVIVNRNSSFGRLFKKETRKIRSRSSINLKRRPMAFEYPKAEITFKNFTSTDKKGVFIEFLNNPGVFEKIRTLIGSELAKDKEQERKENIERIEQAVIAKESQFQNRTMTQLALESTDIKKRFQISHLYFIPQGCPALSRDLNICKIHK